MNINIAIDSYRIKIGSFLIDFVSRGNWISVFGFPAPFMVETRFKQQKKSVRFLRVLIALLLFFLTLWFSLLVPTTLIGFLFVSNSHLKSEYMWMTIPMRKHMFWMNFQCFIRFRINEIIPMLFVLIIGINYGSNWPGAVMRCENTRKLSQNQSICYFFIFFARSNSSTSFGSVTIKYFML